ncbi:hypothetical protein A3Q56_03026 [Intoshia linei]|uniref:Elongator complex protein 6 n=1 Tax=Intoshia linei TaxID=1819745 RepID=A0A177B555_9BILA|nr:hypothetical protein A3Q56_03026 [Intoshia linei]
MNIVMNMFPFHKLIDHNDQFKDIILVNNSYDDILAIIADDGIKYQILFQLINKLLLEKKCIYFITVTPLKYVPNSFHGTPNFPHNFAENLKFIYVNHINQLKSILCSITCYSLCPTLLIFDKIDDIVQESKMFNILTLILDSYQFLKSNRGTKSLILCFHEYKEKYKNIFKNVLTVDNINTITLKTFDKFKFEFNMKYSNNSENQTITLNTDKFTFCCQYVNVSYIG